MADFIELTCKQFETTLNQIDIEYSDVLKKSEVSICCIKNCLKQLKEHVAKNDFRSQAEEIKFFKEIKPSIHGKLLYFIHITDIELKRNFINVESQHKYLFNKLEMLNEFFNENIEFYKYIRHNNSYLDDKYFVRGKIDLILCPDFYNLDADPNFSTSHDLKLAQIVAYDLLSGYLKAELNAINPKGLQNPNNNQKCVGQFSWTGNKIDLVELIYAIHESGSVNKGKADIKDIAKYCEAIFNIDLGDYYRTYLQIKNRPNPCKFINSLHDALVRKIEQQDE